MDLVKFLRKNHYEFSIDKNLRLHSFETETFISKIQDVLVYDPYDYQRETFEKIIKLNRSLVLSPTSSRKEFNYLSGG